MQSPFCERAIDKALHFGNALLKFISPNDVGLTGGHQCGFYLPKSVYQMFTPHPPKKGVVTKYDIKIEWQDDVVTDSVITWYGKETRSEYRLTRFGRGFPYLVHDMVGNLLVLIRKNKKEFLAYILDFDEDIEELQAALGIEVTESWGIYRHGFIEVETEDECIDRKFREFAQRLTEFPQGSVFSRETRRILAECFKHFNDLSADESLMKSMEAEYKLFKLAERHLCHADVNRLFLDIDDFLKTASGILNRRKSRAGRSLENHVEEVLLKAKIPHKMRPNIDGKPDIVIPNEEAYYDLNYPTNKRFIIGVKTTCKDRWRQVLNEGELVKNKHILTTQKGISSNQLNEMHKAKVTLIVPKQLHKEYPKERNITLLTVEEFVSTIRTRLN
jgi:type II restriction enzyme